VLDSWVRYEGQVKIRQQKELSESIIAKIQKELENPKVLQQILQQSITDVESKNQSIQISEDLFLIIGQRSFHPKHNRRGEGFECINISFVTTCVVYHPPVQYNIFVYQLTMLLYICEMWAIQHTKIAWTQNQALPLEA